ncbi:MAG: penicillin acylase family protein [Acidimicrobiia bacterium]
MRGDDDGGYRGVVGWSGRLRVLTVACACALAGATVPALGDEPGAPRIGPVDGPVEDSANTAWSSLNPGNGYFVGPTRTHLDDQRRGYDAIDDAVADGTLDDTGLGRYFEDDRLGVAAGDVEREEQPGGRARIVWDGHGKPHVFAGTADDVAYGAGWATMEARFLYAEVFRAIGRSGMIELRDATADELLGGLDPAAGTIDYSDDELQAQIDHAVASDPAEGPALLARIDAYVAGVNAWLDANPPLPAAFKLLGVQWPKWKRTDVVACAIAIGAMFGQGGGIETKNAAALRSLVERLGPQAGRDAYAWFRRADDPAARGHVDGTWPYPVFDDGSSAAATPPPWPLPASAPILDGAAGPASREAPPHMSNFVIVDAAHSASGRPIMVSGPQVGYVSPSMLLEIELQGGGYRASGVTVPGLGFAVLIGHTDTYAWTITAARNDVVDERIEVLCEPDGSEPNRESTSYLFDGACTPMYRTATHTSTLWRTVHGPVTHRGSVDGRPVAVSQQRASRGFEAMSAAALWKLNSGQVADAADLAPTLSVVPMSMNWGYANAHDIAYFHSGRFPVRAAGTLADMPTWGTGDYEWRGVLDWKAHPQAVDPPAGYLVSWNNRTAHGWLMADHQWDTGAYQRVDLLARGVEAGFVAHPGGMTPADAVAVAQEAATTDARGALVLPALLAKLEGSSPPSAALARGRDVLRSWVAAGAHRRDRDGDWVYDDAALVVSDQIWPVLAALAVAPRAGGAIADLPLGPSDAPPNSDGEAFSSGWMSLEFDAIAAAAPTEAWHWLDIAYQRAASTQWLWLRGRPDLWRKTAGLERVRFVPYVFNGSTMRWQNRPTYQQVLSFDG